MIRERFSRYTALLMWLIRDLWKFGRRKILLVFGAIFLSRTLLSSIFVLLILYLKALESGNASWLQYLPDGITVKALFWPVAVTGSVLYITSSLLDFFVARYAISISAQYSVAVSQRCLAMKSPVLTSLRGFGRQTFPKDMVWISTSGTDMLMRAVRTMLRMASPLIQLFYAAILLLMTEPLAASAVAMIVLPSMGLAYFINSQVLKNEHQLVEANRQRKYNANVLAGKASEIDDPEMEISRFFQQKKWYDTFMKTAWLRSERVVSKERSQTLSNLIVGLGLFVVMSMLGYDALSGNRAWSTVITFIVLMRIAGGSLGGILSSLAFISRLYGTLCRFPVYLRDPAFLPATNPGPLKLKNSLCLGDIGKIKIKPDMVYHIYTDVPLTQTNLWFFASCLSGNKRLSAMDLIARFVLLKNKNDLLANNVNDKKDDKILKPLLVSGVLWKKHSEQLLRKFYNFAVLVCHAKFSQDLENQYSAEPVWIIPAANGNVGLASHAWMKDHMAEIDETLRCQASINTLDEDDDEDDDE